MVGPSITISMTRYAEPDRIVLEGLESLARQRDVSAEVLFLDQTPTPEIAERCDVLTSPSVRFVHDQIAKRGLSFARNEAIRRATSDIL